MLVKILMVPAIMVCALAGTVGLMKGIKKFCPEQFGEEQKSFGADSRRRSK